MFDDLGTLLTDPETFFARLPEDRSLKGPVAIVATLALLAVISSVATLVQFVQAIPAEIRTIFLVGAAIGTLVGAVVPFVQWFLYALAFHGITYFFDGDGEFRDTFLLTGWGFVPRVLSALVSLVVTVYVSTTVEPPTDPAAFAAYSQQLQQSALLQGTTVLGVLFTLWSAYIWVSAVSRARNVTRRQATVAVAIPVAVSVVIAVGSLALNAVA